MSDEPQRPAGYEETGWVSREIPGVGVTVYSSNFANHTYEMTADNFNEKGHTAFLIDATPTTNAEYVEFIEAGGYDDPTHWTESGWKWRQEAALAHPEFWSHHPDGWHRRRYGRWS